MFWVAKILDFSDEFIFLFRVYEHFRGGHSNTFIHVFSMKGALLWEANEPYGRFDVVATDGKKCFYLEPIYTQNAAKTPEPNYHLVCRDLASGKKRFDRPLVLTESIINEWKLKITQFHRLEINPLMASFYVENQEVLVLLSVIFWKTENLQSTVKIEIALADLI